MISQIKTNKQQGGSPPPSGAGGLLPYYKEGVIEAGCDEAGRGCLAGSVYAAAVILPDGFFGSIEIPCRNRPAGKFGHKERGYAFCLAQEVFLAGFAEHHGKAIQAPGLATCPGGFVGVALMGLLCDNAAVLRIVIHYVI